jgi:plastocyanin
MIQGLAATGSALRTLRDGGRSLLRKSGTPVGALGAALFAALAISTVPLAGPSAVPIRAATAATRPTTASAPVGSEVGIRDFAFVPRTLTVSVGTTVTWTNRDEEPHTVTSANGDFSSPGLDTDEAFSRKFTAPGKYTYFCALHPHMTATIIVK